MDSYTGNTCEFLESLSNIYAGIFIGKHVIEVGKRPEIKTHLHRTITSDYSYLPYVIKNKPVDIRGFIYVGESITDIEHINMGKIFIHIEYLKSKITNEKPKIIIKQQIKNKFNLKKLLVSSANQIKRNIFVSNIVNEFRTPLNSLIGYVQLLSKTKMDDEQHKYMSHVWSSSIIFLRLVNDVFDYTNIISGKMEMNLECTSVIKIINTVIELINPKIIEKSQSINVNLELEEDILVDKSKLTQILINILDNACKFTPENGKIEINIDVNNDKILFEIRDNGIGINNTEKIFEPFGKGGLGLAVSKRLVEMMGGSIIAKKLEQGSSFQFDISYKIPFDELKNIHEQRPKNFKGKKILIFNKILKTRMDIIRYLSQWECISNSCGNNDEFNYLLSNDNYDLIIGDCNSDILMPIIPTPSGKYMELELFMKLKNIFRYTTRYAVNDKSYRRDTNIKILIIKNDSSELLRDMLYQLRYTKIKIGNKEEMDNYDTVFTEEYIISQKNIRIIRITNNQIEEEHIRRPITLESLHNLMSLSI
jgi:nitrogen-specific signal transduction histidine kinase